MLDATLLTLEAALRKFTFICFTVRFSTGSLDKNSVGFMSLIVEMLAADVIRGSILSHGLTFTDESKLGLKSCLLVMKLDTLGRVALILGSTVS